MVLGVVVDICEDHGAWLDKGELEALLEAARKKAARSANIKARASMRRRETKARSDGKVKGALFGVWSFLLD